MALLPLLLLLLLLSLLLMLASRGLCIKRVLHQEGSFTQLRNTAAVKKQST